MGKPEGQLHIEALNSEFKLRKGDIKKVVHLGTGQQVNYDHNVKALEIFMEGVPLDEKANAFKIERDFN